jgi:hypothetical protein
VIVNSGLQIEAGNITTPRVSLAPEKVPELMADELEDLDLSQTERYLFELSHQYDERLAEREQCCQRLKAYAELGSEVATWMADAHLPVPPQKGGEPAPICQDFTIDLTPYLLDDSATSNI